MSTKFVAIVLAAVLAAAGVLAFSNSGSKTQKAEFANAPGSVVASAQAAETDPIVNTDAYLGDFKSGYADGFNSGVAGMSYPDQATMTNNSRGYLDGFSQGYTDGQSQQASLRSQLCQTASVAAYTASPGYGSSRYASARRVSSSRVLGDRADRDYYYSAREVDRGIGTTARRALMIAGGAAAGAGIGGALGGKKGAIIGALAGGGTGTALAYTKKPSRAFNRRISKKSVLTKTLIGAGAGAAIGALDGGKRGALNGVAIGGGGVALWSLMSGKRTRR
jgi:hypothetical protein